MERVKGVRDAIEKVGLVEVVIATMTNTTIGAAIGGLAGSSQPPLKRLYGPH
jgi:hypothetical protein